MNITAHYKHVVNHKAVPVVSCINTDTSTMVDRADPSQYYLYSRSSQSTKAYTDRRSRSNKKKKKEKAEPHSITTSS